jgi:hypothetical protein
MNWGNKLLLTFLVFGAGMTFLVYRSLKTNYELVEPDYYKTELAYQQVIDASNRANGLSSPVVLQQTEQGILLRLPEEMKNTMITGNILFYCAYDETRDKKLALTPAVDGTQLFSKEMLPAGSYTVKISWKQSEKSYYAEKILTIL